MEREKKRFFREGGGATRHPRSAQLYSEREISRPAASQDTAIGTRFSANGYSLDYRRGQILEFCRKLIRGLGPACHWVVA